MTTKIPQDVLEAIRDLAVLAKRSHYHCEDCWYSCRLDKDGCSNDNVDKTHCNCGAEEHNAKVDAILARFAPPEVVGVCPCNGLLMVPGPDGPWCPHMENPILTPDVDLHKRWQRANQIPPFLCKYPESVTAAEAAAIMARKGQSMTEHAWKPVEELSDYERVCICMAAGVRVDHIEMTENGVKVKMAPAAIRIHDGRYLVYTL